MIIIFMVYIILFRICTIAFFTKPASSSTASSVPTARTQLLLFVLELVKAKAVTASGACRVIPFPTPY
ncbi:uncharacterized protein BO87DRAFT_378094 [Aspergillus neoniger CBS 115656]|uniref:Uncharacterized protein n=1 Tax=Aspergillus neoniger (strain CBS 115656) TaxID=1448310 RepID=A0A318YJ56_ASPNB|nr:hypothetical protein BO87DRAFT_378094 [Aspergillus neoniger CBS 115656]PYH32603.1 hypothetical protein BO87DRAFT_378094 [Aspergillus neoniger CBS 115656]